MKCLFNFKDKSKTKQGGSKSAPELNHKSKSSGSAIDRATNSSNSLPSPRTISELYKEKEHNLRSFSLQELRVATHGFARMLKIGEGGFGIVYKGSIKPASGQGDPIVVAIKKLNPHSLQGHKQWLAEVQFLGVVNHPNLVKLIGYCSVDGEGGIQRLLVYEFMPNKSLEDHLFNRVLPTMPWKTRLQVMLGAAQGLAYLHCGLEAQVIFRDFKSQMCSWIWTSNRSFQTSVLLEKAPPAIRLMFQLRWLEHTDTLHQNTSKQAISRATRTYGVMASCSTRFSQAGERWIETDPLMSRSCWSG